ncbi:MAG: Maf family protein, partial [Oligoflexales bacterium]|nr:Maf family protein [Oligoflexales bacterium]
FEFEREAVKESSIFNYGFIISITYEDLSYDEISTYVATGEPMDKAGSYGIQGKAAYFVRKITGSYTNVMGLPMTEVYDCLKSLP